MADQFQTVARVGEIVDNEGFPVDVDGVPIALFRVDGAYYAIADSCPHQGAPLCDGAVSGRSVICSWHGWRYSLEDGRRLDAARGQIRTFPVEVVGDEVRVAVAG